MNVVSRMSHFDSAVAMSCTRLDPTVAAAKRAAVQLMPPHQSVTYASKLDEAHDMTSSILPLLQ